MTTSPEPLGDLAGLIALWDQVLTRVPAHGRSLWLAFHDDSQRPLPAVSQIEALPLVPDELAVSNLRTIVEGIVEQTPAVGALLCLERGGTTRPSPFEQSWGEALSTALGDLLVWPVTARTPGGVGVVDIAAKHR